MEGKMKTRMEILVTIEIDSIVKLSDAQRDDILRNCLHDTEYSSYEGDTLFSFRTIEIKREELI
jgi:hypothetical protein